jgi:mono/diheme cytochrome c family protein
VVIVALALAIGCTPAADSESDRRSEAVAGGTFGIGSAASPELIAAMDIDVGPDGVGLPPGEATIPEGLKLYAARCAACHGADGTGGPNDVLAGRIPGDEFPFATEGAGSTVGNYWPYATTLFDYVRKAMPFDAPGSLSDHDVYASVAAILYLNDLIPEDALVDAALIANLVMPARDRFVEDDRAGGPVVR